MIGDPVGALASSRGDDPTALAVRGIALAQLDEGAAARRLLTAAQRGFQRAGDALGAARATAALAELSAAERDLGAARTALTRSITALDRSGDRGNAAWSRLVLARLETLRGDGARAARLLAEAERQAGDLVVLRLTIAIARAEAALRCFEPTAARKLLVAARADVRYAPAVLAVELDRLEAALARPVATLDGRRLDPIGVERARRGAIVVDGLRRRLRAGAEVDLSRRPVLFALLDALAAAYPAAVGGDALIAAAFGARRPNESHRARLRVELGRLRKLLPRTLRLVAEQGWRLDGRGAPLTHLRPLVPTEHAALDALLADGAAWSARELAEVLDASARTVQRMLANRPDAFAAVGRGRNQRWVARAASGFATQMLLLGLSGGA